MPVRLNWKHHVSPGATGPLGSNSGKMACVGWMLLAGQRSPPSSFLKQTFVFLKTGISFGSNVPGTMAMVSVTCTGFKRDAKEKCDFAANTPVPAARRISTDAVMKVFLFIVRMAYKQIGTPQASASRSVVDLPVSGLRASVR